MNDRIVGKLKSYELLLCPLDLSKSMKIKTSSTFFVLFAIVVGMTTSSAFAEPVMVSTPQGTSVPGCEETNECFLPYQVTVDVGGEVTWSNDDIAAHTVTAGGAADGPSGEFDSSLFMAGTTFSHTFEEAGEFPYFCMVHPWMEGIVTVGGAMDEVMEEKEMMEVTMSGNDLDLTIDPMLPFDTTTQDMITLSFTAKSDELMGTGELDHLDYRVVISKDGSEVWSEEFHDHDGNLELQITPTEGSFEVSGGEEGSSSTGTFMVQGPIFMENGDYTISGQVIGIEFEPLSTPIVDDFSINVVPEFGTVAMMILTVAIISIVAVTAKTRVIPRL